MNIDQIGKFIATLVSQVGIDGEKAERSADFWKPNLLKLEYEKSIEAIKVLLLNNNIQSKDPGKWISQVVRYCGGSDVATKKEINEPVTTWCNTCMGSGVMEVPHSNIPGKRVHWIEGRWDGQYTMSVACDCGAGQMKACQMMGIRQYESQYQNWRLEYPLRRWMWQLEMILSRQSPLLPEDITKRNGRIHDLQQLIKTASCEA